MKILIAPDKFKGSLSAQAVIDAIASGIRKTNQEVTILEHPMADGGDGSLDVLQSSLALYPETVETLDPLGRPLLATYLRNEEQAFIELASASGLVLLKNSERNPLETSTYGTGLMIRHALEQGISEIYLFLGGSATNDLGMGIATALGYQLLNVAGEILSPTGANLQHLHQVKKNSAIADNIQFHLLCDVTNPPFGPHGAAYVYAAQKGATPLQIETLDQGLEKACRHIAKQFGVSLDQLAGGGAAGGVGAGLHALFGARLIPGFQAISELTGLTEKLTQADVVISGEGKLDGQSLAGKVVDGMARLCRQYHKPLYLFAGAIDLTSAELQALQIKNTYAIIDRAKSLEDAIDNASTYLSELAAVMEW
jgi:glycerate kinase